MQAHIEAGLGGQAFGGELAPFDVGHLGQQTVVAVYDSYFDTAMVQSQSRIDTDKAAAEDHRPLNALLADIAVDGYHVGQGLETEYPGGL